MQFAELGMAINDDVAHELRSATDGDIGSDSAKGPISAVSAI